MRESALARAVADRWPWRLALALAYLVPLMRYLSASPDPARFPGMVGPPPAGAGPAGSFDLMAFAFMVVGLLMSLDQPGEYLLEDDWMVYIRRRRGLARYARYAGLVGLYCLAFALPQLAYAALQVPGARPGPMAAGMAGACWLLALLLLVLDTAAMAGSLPVGFLACLALAWLVADAGPVRRALSGHTAAGLPGWAPPLALATLAVAAASLTLYKRAEVL